MANLLIQNGPGGNATVTVCHSRTRDLPSITRLADILVVAIGKPEFVTADMVKPGAVGHRRRHQPGGRRAEPEAATVSAATWTSTPVAEVAGAITPGARRRGPDDHRHAAGEHAAGSKQAGGRAWREGGQPHDLSSRNAFLPVLFSRPSARPPVCPSMTSPDLFSPLPDRHRLDCDPADSRRRAGRSRAAWARSGSGARSRGLKKYQSGHWYFSLRDAASQMQCVMWRTTASRQAGPPPAEGTEVFACGTAGHLGGTGRVPAERHPAAGHRRHRRTASRIRAGQGAAG